jgi:hypothetical protein
MFFLASKNANKVIFFGIKNAVIWQYLYLSFLLLKFALGSGSTIVTITKSKISKIHKCFFQRS